MQIKKIQKPDHPRKGEYYFIQEKFVQVRKVEWKIEFKRIPLPRKSILHRLEYKTTDEIIGYELEDVWWWNVGDETLPNRQWCHSSRFGPYYNWKEAWLEVKRRVGAVKNLLKAIKEDEEIKEKNEESISKAE